MYDKKTIDEINNICNKYGLKWIDGKYNNIYSRLKCEDQYGFLYNITLNGLLSNSQPKILHKHNIYSLYNLNLYFKLYKPNIELLTEKYDGYDLKLKCRCRICNHIWTPVFNSIKVGKGCPKCIDKERTGALSITLAQRNKIKWTNKKSKVYIIKCFNEEEIFYKIGITTKNVTNRFLNKGNIPYLYEILYEINTNLYEAVFIEKELHYDNKEYKYEPLIKFDGHTECFSKINENKIIYIQNNIENYRTDINYKTNCHIDIDNLMEDIRLLNKEQLITLLIKLNSYRLSAINLELQDELYISNYLLKDWINDVKLQLKILY